jgi:hypothetical protein
MSWETSYIDDGYQESGYIAADEGLHGPLTFTYRPVLVQTRDTLNALIARDTPDTETFVRKVTEQLAKSVIEWSLRNKGELVPINADTMRRVRPRLLDKLWGVVSGARRSDTRDSRIPDLEGDAKNWRPGSGCCCFTPEPLGSTAATASGSFTTSIRVSR